MFLTYAIMPLFEMNLKVLISALQEYHFDLAFISINAYQPTKEKNSSVPGESFLATPSFHFWSSLVVEIGSVCM